MPADGISLPPKKGDFGTSRCAGSKARLHQPGDWTEGGMTACGTCETSRRDPAKSAYEVKGVVRRKSSEDRSLDPSATLAGSKSRSAAVYCFGGQRHGLGNEVDSVTDPLDSVLVELEQFGKVNDASTAERTRRMLNITRDTGEFLAVLVRATLARRVLEIGTSNGYSTLWLANAARAIGGSVTTVELADYKIGLAAANFARAGLARYISIVHDDAGRVLERSADGSFDLVFLDSERPEYPGWWPNLRRVLRPGGLLVVDNATSHPEQMAPFVALVSADAEFSTSLVPVGNGEFLAVRSLE
jgi:predicted O-methyltransferase YrrM